MGLSFQVQLHFDLLALTKPLTELTTLAESAVIAAICAAEGLDGSTLTALWSASTDDLTALVSLGKSLLAALTSDVASLRIVVSCDCRPLIPLLEVALGSPLIEFSRLVRSEQYAGLLLPQPATAISTTAATIAPAIRLGVRHAFARNLCGLIPFKNLTSTVDSSSL
jgi:hypothetical protein